MKSILKLLLSIIAVLAAVAGLTFWQKNCRPEYVEIYSDNEDDLF